MTYKYHRECDHIGYEQYVRRTFSNGTVHYGIQCEHCLKMVKHARHNGKLFIKHSEIPPGYDIHPYREVR